MGCRIALVGSLMISLAFWASAAVGALPDQQDKSPYYVYARAGDPLRIVWSVQGERSMGIAGEGPLRARCFVMGSYYRELTLTGPRESAEQPVRTEAELAHALDVETSELPPDLVTLWRDGSIDWKPFEPGERVAVSGPADTGPYRVVGPNTYCTYLLARGRGSLLVCYYGSGWARVLRIPAPKAEYEIRPGVGLKEMVKAERLVPSDIPRHLERIDAGLQVDWAEIGGYTRY